jgi:hypothetical protein
MGALTMDERQPLELRFKGDRNYIQGPDIFDAVLSRLSNDAGTIITDIDFSFHRLAFRAVDLVVTEGDETLNPVAVCQYITAGTKRRVYVVETSREITERYDYPEHDIVRAMKIDAEQRICKFYGDLPYSDIEIWVSMTKALHQKVFTTLKGKWLFVRGRFIRYNSEGYGAPRELSIKANFNNKLTRSEAVCGEKKIGEIYFSIV